MLQAINEVSLKIPCGMPDQWIVDCANVGKGLPALKYLSRYLYRGVISEKKIVADDDTCMTFSYLDNTGTQRSRTLKGEDFLWLLFQHILPKGFRRISVAPKALRLTAKPHALTCVIER